MLATALIPTRNRVKGLLRSIDSIMNTAHDKENARVIVKVDDDDPTRLEIPNSTKFVRVVTSPRGNGYPDLDRYTQECCDHAFTPWCFNFDDDAYFRFEGAGLKWDQQLEALPERFYAQPEAMLLNGQLYTPDQAEFCVFFPNRFWEMWGHDHIVGAPDSFVLRLLTSKGYRRHILKGLIDVHERGPDEEVAKYHKEAIKWTPT